MDLQHVQSRAIESLTEYLSQDLNNVQFRRRAVLAWENTQFKLICCTVEPVSSPSADPARTVRLSYLHALLYEDILSRSECIEFVDQLENKVLEIDENILAIGTMPQWKVEFAQVGNPYMLTVGKVVSAQFSASTFVRLTGEVLLSATAPYYPDIYEAAKHWLSFPQYHGASDGRNGQVVFLMPETRAFIADAHFTSVNTLRVNISGTQVAALPLRVKGAYWEYDAIHHIDEPTNQSQAILTIPAHADRLEFYLIDDKSLIYSFHKENKYSAIKLDRTDSGSADLKLENQVRAASVSGEGESIEFKPFTELELQQRESGKKTKLEEVITTAVAFANTVGGHIYLGIHDDCSIAGISQGLQKWAKSKPDESTISKYIGTLKSAIRDALECDIELNISSVTVDGALVVVIEVLQSPDKPITLKQNGYYFRRLGANNRKLSPRDWKRELELASAA